MDKHDSDGHRPGAPGAGCESWRDVQRRRVEAIASADWLVAQARSCAARGGAQARRASRILLAATTRYMAAGLSRRGQVAWRLARLLHAAACRAGGEVATHQASRRQARGLERWLELAVAVEVLTAEHGRPPGWPRLAVELGITKSSVRELARRARAAGVVQFTDNQPQTIRVVR